MRHTFIDFLNLMIAEPVYAVAAVVGLFLGVAFALDGWTASAKASGDLKSAPRVQNFRWILGGGVLAGLGDVHKISQGADRFVLLFFYIVGVGIGAAATMVLTGFTIYFTHARIVEQGDSTSYSAGEAVIDYVFRGYRLYRQRVEESKALAATLREGNVARFQLKYYKQLSFAILAAGSPSITRANCLEYAQQVLRNVTTVVRGFHENAGIDLRVKSNVMVRRPCDAACQAKLLFVTAAERPLVTECLELMRYDSEDVRNILLPLPPNRLIASALPGAPYTLVAERFDIIDDTNKLKYPEKMVGKLKDEMKLYFREQNFRSFASLVIGSRGRIIGVLNVESEEPFVFGEEKAAKQKIADALEPFCSVLGIMLADLL